MKTRLLTLKKLSKCDNVSKKLYYSNIHPIDVEEIEEILYYSRIINKKLFKENNHPIIKNNRPTISTVQKMKKIL